MITELEDRIRQRAHTIWESEGRPGDRAAVHWSMASAAIPAETPAKAPRAAKAAAAAAPKVEKAEKAPRAKAAAKPKASRA